MKTLLLSVFCLITLASCTEVPEPFEPIIPKHGPPVLFNSKEYPLEQWRSKSATNFPWFVETKDGWHIDWDCERRPIEYLVVHHSAGSGQETREDISETVYRQVYGWDAKFYSVYRDPKYKEPYVLELPIHSGHVISGVETFSAYHFLIHPDGRIITTLVPHREVSGKLFVDMVAWGAGNWKVNCASVQVCLLGAYTKDKPPSLDALHSLTRIIHYYQRHVSELRVVSHDEVRTAGKKNCPGGWFEEWRKALK